MRLSRSDAKPASSGRLSFGNSCAATEIAQMKSNARRILRLRVMKIPPGNSGTEEGPIIVVRPDAHDHIQVLACVPFHQSNSQFLLCVAVPAQNAESTQCIPAARLADLRLQDRKSTRLNSSHVE